MLRRLGSYLCQHHLALLALFIALGGTSYAAIAIKLPANSVGSAQIKNKAVTPKKVSKAAVKLFRGKKGAKGSRGATGLTGPPGPQGAPGGTAWAFAENAPGLGSETPIPASATTVLSLANPINPSFTAGILATATVTIRQTGAATTPIVSCHLVIDGAPGIEQQVTFSGAIGEY